MNPPCQYLPPHLTEFEPPDPSTIAEKPIRALLLLMHPVTKPAATIHCTHQNVCNCYWPAGIVGWPAWNCDHSSDKNLLIAGIACSLARLLAWIVRLLA
ncbi:hypothetical protein ACFX2G_005857 [Malus domestica]